jgi:TPP-dependent indolepyruvate ferredoxin oxidoreductase alpha subunit
VVTHVPGYGANQTFEAINKLSEVHIPVSFNEEVAFTIAHGASLVGVRAATLFKSHGFVKAGNSVVDSLPAGSSAGFLNVIFHDREGKHSDSIFNISSYLEGIGVPYRGLDPGAAYRQVQQILLESESRGLPYALVVDSEQVEAETDFRRSELAPPQLEYQREIHRTFLQPVFARYQARVAQAKRSGKDWRGMRKPEVPHFPDDLPPIWSMKMAPYVPFFDAFKPVAKGIVTGDTGISHLFAFRPYDCFDLSTYMGGSVPLAIGAYLAGFPEVWALCGDFSFVAAGHMGLPEAVNRDVPLKLVIFDNGEAAATGGQPVPKRILYDILEGYQRYVRVCSQTGDRAKIRETLQEISQADQMRILVLDYRDEAGQ